jgi:serpin B
VSAKIVATDKGMKNRISQFSLLGGNLVNKATALELVFLAGFFIFSNAMTVHAETLSADMQQVVNGNTAFATDLYAMLKHENGNLFFSPYSISTALAMTLAGARGDTAQQMANVLHFAVPQDRLHPAFAELEAELNAIQKKGEVQLSVANSLWPQKDYQFLPDYVGLLKQYYGTSVTPLDYVSATEAARKTINDWVEGKTNRKITDLIKPGVLGPDMLLVLANAVYFKGNWVSQFNPKQTREQSFHTATDTQVASSMMNREGKCSYAETPDLQVLELPYDGNDLSMIVLLPRKAEGIGALESELTPVNLAQWTQALSTRKIILFLPKFKLTCEFSLEKRLAAMGITDAFSSNADFSGMDGSRSLSISAVLHKAFVDVNEQGTEAAAATEVTMRSAAPPTIPEFRADHPFVFLIRDKHTDSILFLGRVTDPTK